MATHADHGRHRRQPDRSVAASDVLIDGETIAAVARARPGRRRRASPPTRTIDATGKYVIPGGIDVHTHMELPFGGTDASRHVRDRHHAPRRGAASPRSSTSPCRTPASSVQDGARPRGTRKADGNCAIDYALPPDHRRRRRRVAEGDDVPRRQRGHHQLQAVHGLPGRLLHRRRPDPAGHADGRRVRGDDHDARRERHRHRRARRAGARPRRDRPEVPRASPGPPTLEGEATHRAIVLAKVAGNVPLYIVHMSAGGGARGGRRGPPRRAATCSPRPARSTST